jgi:hypothetical protein
MANIKSVIKTGRVETIIKKAFRDNKLLNELALYLKERVYSFTKRGKSLVTGDSLKPLSPGYVKWRRKLGSAKQKNPSKRRFDGFHTQHRLAIFKKKKKRGTNIQTGDFFSAARSNLTLTGQMLDALTTDVDTTIGQFKVTVKDNNRKDGEKTNLEVAKEVAKNGRPFLGVDAKGIDVMRRKVIADLRRKLKR